MYIRTTKNIITDIQGFIKIRKTHQNTYGIVLTSPLGVVELAEYDSQESAENVITSICVAIEDAKPLFVMPNTLKFTKEDMVRRNRH